MVREHEGSYIRLIKMRRHCRPIMTSHSVTPHNEWLTHATSSPHNMQLYIRYLIGRSSTLSDAHASAWEHTL